MKIRDYIMKKKTAKKIGWLIGALGVVVILAATYGLSWIITCGIIKLITICFGWTFKWSIATGIWLIMCLVRSALNHTITVKK